MGCAALQSVPVRLSPRHRTSICLSAGRLHVRLLMWVTGRAILFDVLPLYGRNGRVGMLRCRDANDEDFVHASHIFT
jgi:hypothetical protein